MVYYTDHHPESLKVLRQRPTLPLRCQSSTIGAVGLNYCVRYGNRCVPHAIATGNSSAISYGLHTLHSENYIEQVNQIS